MNALLLGKLGKKGQGANPWEHLGGWIIALAVLVFLIVVILGAFNVIDIDFIRNLRFG